MNNSEARSMKDLVSVLIRQLGLNEAIIEQKIKSDWAELIGEIACTKIEVISLKSGILYLNSTASVWTNELNLRKAEIIHRINEKYNSEIVRNIIIG